MDATSELISLIQPILSEYANNNSISIIFQKKNIVIGKTELDITEDILKILNENHKKIVINLMTISLNKEQIKKLLPS